MKTVRVAAGGEAARGRRARAVFLAFAILSAGAATAQTPYLPLPTGPSPAEPRTFALAPENPPLPPLAVLQPRVGAGLFPPLEFPVRAFDFSGNRVFSKEELARVTAPYAGRTITAEELEQARLAVTAHYVQAGYVNSGAVLEDQDLAGGVVVFKIVEGTLDAVELRGNRWLRTSFIQHRLARWTHPPLQVARLQEALLLLNEYPMIVKVNADLQPAGEPGKSRLVVNVKERFPFHAGLEFSNDRPASVGAEHLDFIGSDQSLTGNGDALDFRLGLLNRSKGGAVSGLENFSVGYLLPLTPWDTTLRLAYRQNDYTVIEEPFAAIGIDGRSSSFDIALRQPLYRTPQTELALSLTGSRRRSETFLAGRPFSLSPGAVDGESSVTVLRFGQEWLSRTQQQVIALRSSFHFGIDALGATNDGTRRNGEFFAWLGQGQYIRRLDRRGTQVILRGDAQWTSDQLLSLEQFSIGGIDTVRGYRENQIVRDTGVIGSVELRVPVWLRGTGRPILQVAGFYDIGAGWDVGAATPDPKMIHSAGVGLIFSPNDKINAEIYWAHRFTETMTPEKKDLQDWGLNFRVAVYGF